MVPLLLGAATTAAAVPYIVVYFQGSPSESLSQWYLEIVSRAGFTLLSPCISFQFVYSSVALEMIRSPPASTFPHFVWRAFGRCTYHSEGRASLQHPPFLTTSRPKGKSRKDYSSIRITSISFPVAGGVDD